MLVIEILLIVTLFLWFLSLLPVTPAAYSWSISWLAWVSVVLLTLYILLPQVR